jgi:phospholipid-binding lipoprotein MlaA
MRAQILRRAAGFGAAALLATLLAACATPPAANDPDAVADYKQTNDPLEPTNRVFYAVNDGLDTVLLRPLAIAYKNVVPQFGRTRIHNVLSNLGSPVALADDILATNPRRAGDTLMRMVINSTVGFAGMFDVASDWGYPSHDSDFGIALALWGVPEGPFLYLPVLGPTNPRDATGFGVDVGLDPLTYLGKGTIVTALDYSRFGLSALDARTAVLDDVDKIKQTALDPYATFRSLSRQHRTSVIDNARADNRATVPAWFPQPSASDKR